MHIPVEVAAPCQEAEAAWRDMRRPTAAALRHILGDAPSYDVRAVAVAAGEAGEVEVRDEFAPVQCRLGLARFAAGQTSTVVLRAA